MELGLISKVIFFASWPLLLLLIIYLIDKKKFKAKWERLNLSELFKFGK